LIVSCYSVTHSKSIAVISLLEPGDLVGKKVLDVAGGVSSFCAEASQLGMKVTSFDPIYSLAPEKIT
jgi:2-polyprenyl-3-methyl-5-hydroxy-6-metoxy-1,4-benzoquinol methylase